MSSASNAIIFLGPTVTRAEARKHLKGDIRPPAARGDIWKAMLDAPRVIVLIDGVFEGQPSVWHRELLEALSAGITVFGAASMGALRAVELASYGMIGVGEIFRAYRDGVLLDDSEVALLHASAEHDFRPLTVPLVNVRYAAKGALSARVLSPNEAKALVAAAEKIFYQDRHWPALLRAVSRGWRKGTLERWTHWSAGGLADPKAKDARECLTTAREFLATHVPPHRGAPVWPSAAARHLKIQARKGSAAGRELTSSDLRTRLIAAWARTLGVQATVEERRLQEDRWFTANRVSPARRGQFLKGMRLDKTDAERLFEDLALEEKMIANSGRIAPDSAV